MFGMNILIMIGVVYNFNFYIMVKKIEEALLFFAEHPAWSIQCENSKWEQKWIHCFEDVYDFFNK